MRVIDIRKQDYNPTGKAPGLTAARLAILDCLQDVRYRRPSEIGQLLGYTATTEIVGGKPFIRYHYLRREMQRLRKDGGYLFCPSVGMNREAVYALTDGGEHALKQAGLYRGVHKTGEPFEDELGISFIRTSLEIGLKEFGLTPITALDILNHQFCPETTRVSDTPFEFKVSFDYTTLKTNKVVRINRTIKHDSDPFGFARPIETGRLSITIAGIELDLDTEGLRSEKFTKTTVSHHMLGILAATNDRVYHKQLGIPTPYILFYCVGSLRTKAAMQTLSALTNGKGAKNILFATIGDYRDRGGVPGIYPSTGSWALTQTYQRVGHPPINLLDLLEVKEKAAA